MDALLPLLLLFVFSGSSTRSATFTVQAGREYRFIGEVARTGASADVVQSEVAQFLQRLEDAGARDVSARQNGTSVIVSWLETPTRSGPVAPTVRVNRGSVSVTMTILAVRET